MKLADLRINIFRLWIAFWILSTLGLVVSPWARTDKAIGAEQILSALLSISGIWIPPLTCLATFWFPQEEQQTARNTKATRDRVYGALTFTITYLLFVLGMVLWVIYIVDYYPESDELPVGASFQNRLDYVLKIALITSPLALAPIGWLTGAHTSKDEG
jgi:hypothetical protein